jgi:hypothetical protein
MHDLSDIHDQAWSLKDDNIFAGAPSESLWQQPTDLSCFLPMGMGYTQQNLNKSTLILSSRVSLLGYRNLKKLEHNK